VFGNDRVDFLHGIVGRSENRLCEFSGRLGKRWGLFRRCSVFIPGGSDILRKGSGLFRERRKACKLLSHDRHDGVGIGCGCFVRKSSD
jgi:hypothetical protein